MQAGEVDTNLIDWYKPKIDKKILKELSKRSNWQGLKHIVEIKEKELDNFLNNLEKR